MRFSPAKCLEYIEENTTIDAKPRPVREMICVALEANGWVAKSDSILETAEKWELQIIELIDEKTQQYIDSFFGHMYPICLNSSNNTYVQGACFAEPGESEKTAQGKLRRASAHRIENLLRNLTPAQFELLCGKLLKVIGVETPTVTTHSNDQGLDFFGRWELRKFISNNPLPPGAEKQLNTWIVGQAKHYNKTKIGTGEIRELVGSVKLAKSKTYGNANDPLLGLEIRPCDSVFCWFVTSGHISKDGWRLLHGAGIVTLDAKLIGMLIADLVESAYKEIHDLENLCNWIESP